MRGWQTQINRQSVTDKKMTGGQTDKQGDIERLTGNEAEMNTHIITPTDRRTDWQTD